MKKLIFALMLMPFINKAQNQDTLFMKNGDYIAGKIETFNGKNYIMKNVVSNCLGTVSKYGGGISDNAMWYVPFGPIDRVKDFKD